MCCRYDWTRCYRLQRRSYNGLPGLVLGQWQRQIHRIHENTVDERWQKYYCMRRMAGKTIYLRILASCVFCTNQTEVSLMQLCSLQNPTTTVGLLFIHELKNITEHLLTDNELFSSFVYFSVYTSFRTRMLWGILAWNPWHGAFLQINMLHFYRLRKWWWDGDSKENPGHPSLYFWVLSWISRCLGFVQDFEVFWPFTGKCVSFTVLRTQR